ncbi:MAG: Pvc16 family protein [Chloroflexota bacterium]|nr:Pvc16 family protein [Chloroflexota bacterium]
MSNHLAVATVTATLKQMLDAAATQDVTGAGTTVVRPDKIPNNKAGINIFLYRVTPNAAWRSSDLPTRDSRGQLTALPRAALDLHYLLSFYGDDAKLEPQRLLGSAVRTLQGRPVLSRDKIRAVITSTSFSPILGNSNLADEVELVKFAPLPLTLDDFSKLWNSFQGDYYLSVAYQSTVVLIEPETSPQSALPVRERNVYVVPFGQPTIEAVEPQMLPISGGPLTLRGRNLLAHETVVAFGDLESRPTGDSGPERLEVPLPPGIRAGINPVQVIQRILMGAPEPHEGFKSNVAAFVLQPTLSSLIHRDDGTPLNRQVEATVVPSVEPRQEVVLLLNEVGGSGRGFTLPACPRTAVTGTITFSVHLGATRIPPGSYLGRVRVDGAESVLNRDANGRFTGPMVNVP